MFGQDTGLVIHYTQALILGVVTSCTRVCPLLNWLKRKLVSTQADDANSARAGRAAELISSGIAAESRGDVEAAEEMFRQATDISPEWAQAHLNLGMARQSKGDLRGAVASYERAIAL